MKEATYPLAPQGVFLTANGEGVFLGTPMVFIRLAGCNVNCDSCDTDYSVAERVPVAEIVRRVAGESAGHPWVWVTGGEPTISDLRPLCGLLHEYGFRVALATAGVTEDVPRGNSHVVGHGFDFVSVSPHFLDGRWKLRRGDQCNLVPGLHGLRLEDVNPADFEGFSHRFVTPFWYAPADRVERTRECWEWVQRHPGWRLGTQAHRTWGLA